MCVDTSARGMSSGFACIMCSSLRLQCRATHVCYAFHGTVCCLAFDGPCVLGRNDMAFEGEELRSRFAPCCAQAWGILQSSVRYIASQNVTVIWRSCELISHGSRRWYIVPSTFAWAVGMRCADYVGPLYGIVFGCLIDSENELCQRCWPMRYSVLAR